MPLSNKDKARLRLADKRVEKWNREKLKPVKPLTDADKASKESLQSVSAIGQKKPSESIKADAMERVHRLTDGANIRSMSDKLARAELGATRSHMHTQESKCYVTGEVTRQAIAHNPPRLVLQKVNKLIPDRAGNLVSIPEYAALAVDKRDSLDLVPSVKASKQSRQWIKDKRNAAKARAKNMIDNRRESV